MLSSPWSTKIETRSFKMLGFTPEVNSLKSWNNKEKLLEMAFSVFVVTWFFICTILFPSDYTLLEDHLCVWSNSYKVKKNCQ